MTIAGHESPNPPSLNISQSWPHQAKEGGVAAPLIPSLQGQNGAQKPSVGVIVLQGMSSPGARAVGVGGV